VPLSLPNGPKAVLKAQANMGRLSHAAVFDPAADRQINSDVVAKQAYNNRIQVSQI